MNRILDRIGGTRRMLDSHRVDVILLSGDIANMPMEYDLPQEETDKYYKDMEAVITSVSSIQSNMYYIPGNVSNWLHV